MKKINQLLFQKAPIKLGKLPYIIFSAVLFTVLSCSTNEDVEISNESILEANLVASKGIENAPAESGAFVFRNQYEGEIALTLVDSKSKLVATIGYPDLLPTYCGGGASNDILTFQEILATNNGERVVSLAQGDMKVNVFGGTLYDIYDFSSWCPFLSSAPLLAQGNAKATAPTNDVWLTNTNNTANIILQINGELLSPANERKHFTARVLFSYDKVEEFNTLLDILVSVTVQLH
ncbi:MAG TPA: hypothetical protein VKN14_01590 [Flavobacteriaceae bacterium]|nr:hypothetical protein [Flavobacteriaceae bacterium]